MRYAVIRVLAFSGLMHAGVAAHAGVTERYMETSEGNVVGLLEDASAHYVDAMRSIIMERFPEEYREIRWETLGSAMTRHGVARFEYRYSVNGVEQVRVYLGMDGPPLSTVARDIFARASRPPTPPTPNPSSRASTPETPSPDLAAEMDAMAEQVEIDARDGAYFAAINENTHRAALLPQEGSQLYPLKVDGSDRGMDAEFKILRHVEDDLTRGRIPKGGQLQGFVSDTTCVSCSYAMQTLSEQHGVDIRVTQLRPAFSVAREKELIASGLGRLKGTRLVSAADGSSLLAHDQLAEARSAQATQHLRPTALSRSFKGRLWRQRSLRRRVPRVSDVPEESGTSNTGTSESDSGAGVGPGC